MKKKTISEEEIYCIDREKEFDAMTEEEKQKVVQSSVDIILDFYKTRPSMLFTLKPIGLRFLKKKSEALNNKGLNSILSQLEKEEKDRKKVEIFCKKARPKLIKIFYKQKIFLSVIDITFLMLAENEISISESRVSLRNSINEFIEAARKMKFNTTKENIKDDKKLIASGKAVDKILDKYGL